MSKSVVIVLFFGLFYGCTNSVSNKKPEDLISKNKFIDLLCETTLLEGYLTNENLNIPEIRDKGLGKYKSIFEDFDVSNKQYQESYEYYVQQPYFKEMLEKAIQELEEREKHILDVSEIKQMSFGQFQTLLKSEKEHLDVILDTSINNKKKIDYISSYYEKHPKKLSVIAMDSLSFQYSLNRYREGKLFSSIIKSLKLNPDDK